MSHFIAFAKLVGGPGSLRLLAILLLLGVIWSVVWPKRPRSGAVAMAFLVAVYAVMAMPAVAAVFVNALPKAPAEDRARVRSIRTIFFIDGDNRFGRLRAFERIYAEAHPENVYLLGRLSVYKDLLLMPEVSRQALHHEPSAANTVEQIARVKELIAAGASTPCALLVSSLQYPRVASFIRTQNLPCFALAGPLDDAEEIETTGVRRWMPSLGTLAATRDAIYELAALRYYD